MEITLKRNKNLASIVQAAGREENEVIESLINGLIDKQMINGDRDDYGQTVWDAIDRDTTVNEFIKVLHDAGIEKVKSTHVDALLACEIMGPGDCPMCGGNMEETDGDYKTIFNGYDEPYDLEPIWQEYTCDVCGYTKTTGKQD